MRVATACLVLVPTTPALADQQCKKVYEDTIRLPPTMTIDKEPFFIVSSDPAGYVCPSNGDPCSAIYPESAPPARKVVEVCADASKFLGGKK